jgi:hypothetical protein
LYANLGEIKGKERPIAARRNLIRSASQIESEAIGSLSEPSTPKEKGIRENESEEGSSFIEPPAKDEDDTEKKPLPPTSETSNVKETTSTKQTNEKKSEKVGDNGAQEQGSQSPAYSKSSLPKLPPPKTLEEIEREVAENTAKFDRNMSFRSNNKLTPERLAQLEQLAQRKNTSTVDPSNLMRLIRLLVIGLLAAYTGYRTAEVSRHEALQPSRLVELQTIKEFDDFGNVVAEIPVAHGEILKENPAEGRTWIGYFQDQYTRRAECTISAVMLAWWIAGIFKRFISKQKQQKSKVNIIEQVYNYVNGFQEAAFSTLGEFGWHLFVLIFTVACHTMYFSQVALEKGSDSTSNSCVLGGDGTCLAPSSALSGEL